jgi:hypothetical protein
MNKNIKLFGDVLRARTELKKVQQISWNTRAVEDKYIKLDKMSEEELVAILGIYRELFEEILQIQKTIKGI